MKTAVPALRALPRLDQSTPPGPARAPRAFAAAGRQIRFPSLPHNAYHGAMDWSRLSFLHPRRVLNGLRRRTPRQAVLQGLRQVGAALDRGLVGPRVIRVNPMGYVCNHACPMCWLQHLDPAELRSQKTIDRESGLRLDDYRRMFDGVPVGLEEVELVGGGEPLVHPEAIGIMAEIKRRGWRGSMISNGSLLREPIARRMVEIGWDFTRVSVHAGDAETYRLIQGVDRFETTRENLIAFTRLRSAPGVAKRGQLCVYHVIQRENLGSIDRLFAFAEEVGADALFFEKIIPYDDAKVLSADEWRRAREAVLACARESRVPVNVEHIGRQVALEEKAAAATGPWVPARRCSVGFDQSFVTALGDVMPCCFSKEVMGNVREQSFAEIWAGPRYANFRRRLNHGKFAKYCIENRCSMDGVLHH